MVCLAAIVQLVRVLPRPGSAAWASAQAPSPARSAAAARRTAACGSGRESASTRSMTRDVRQHVDRHSQSVPAKALLQDNDPETSQQENCHGGRAGAGEDPVQLHDTWCCAHLSVTGVSYAIGRAQMKPCALASSAASSMSCCEGACTWFAVVASTQIGLRPGQGVIHNAMQRIAREAMYQNLNTKS